MLPAFLYFGEFRGVVYRLPPPALHLLRSASRVVIPALVVPEDPAVGVRHPAQLRDRVGQRPELALTFAQRFLRAPLLRNVSIGSEPAYDSPAGFMNRYGARKKPAVSPVVSSEGKRVLPGNTCVPRTLNSGDDP